MRLADNLSSGPSRLPETQKRRRETRQDHTAMILAMASPVLVWKEAFGLGESIKPDRQILPAHPTSISTHFQQSLQGMRSVCARIPRYA
jgi:hypothetical protein